MLIDLKPHSIMHVILKSTPLISQI